MLEQAAHQDTKPDFNLVQPGSVLGSIDEADAMSFILQEGHAGLLRFQDPAATFLAQVKIQLATFGNQAHQRLRAVDIELVNDKDPAGLWVEIDRAFDVLGKIRFCAGCSNRRRDAFARSNFQIGNQSLGAMADVFMFIERDLAGLHGLGRAFSLQRLNAGLFIRTDQMCTLRIQLNGLMIQVTNDPHQFVKSFRVLLSFIAQPVMTAMGLQISFALKNAPLDGLRCCSQGLF